MVDFDVYAMKLQPGDADDGTNPYEFCKQEEVIGVGWHIERGRTYETVEDVYDQHYKVAQRRAEEGKDVTRLLADNRLETAIRYILKKVDEGDYVWVNEGSDFALCRAREWDVLPNLPEEKADEYDKRDIQNFRYVDWVDIPYALVPGYVRRKFSRPFGTICEMDKGINDDSKAVIESLHSHEELDTEDSLNRKHIAEKISAADTQRVFDVLGPTETEDIVLSYLQSEGWRIIKSSTSDSEAKIECEMRREENGESVLGYLQVKTGDAGLNPDSYQEYADAGEMIFFLESGVDVEGRDSMSKITPEEIHEYIVSDVNYLPNEPLLKLDFALE